MMECQMIPGARQIDDGSANNIYQLVRDNDGIAGKRLGCTCTHPAATAPDAAVVTRRPHPAPRLGLRASQTAGPRPTLKGPNCDAS
jgi:hypothetical protein